MTMNMCVPTDQSATATTVEGLSLLGSTFFLVSHVSRHNYTTYLAFKYSFVVCAFIEVMPCLCGVQQLTAFASTAFMFVVCSSSSCSWLYIQ